eukprot:scaffold14518_cov44-Cyclotella_meneghiniana.AAC.1
MPQEGSALPAKHIDKITHLGYGVSEPQLIMPTTGLGCILKHGDLSAADLHIRLANYIPLLTPFYFNPLFLLLIIAASADPPRQLDAGYILRHIMYSFGIPLILQMPSLWAAFYYLIMRKPIPKRAIASQSSIWNHVFPVHLIDSELAARVFIEFITLPSQSGFRRSFGISTD